MSALRQFLVSRSWGSTWTPAVDAPPLLGSSQVRKDEAVAMERFIVALPGGAGRLLEYTTSDFTAPAPGRLAHFPGFKTLLDVLEFDDGGAQAVFMNVLHADRVLLSETGDYKPLLYSDAAHSLPREGVYSVLLRDGCQIQSCEQGEGI